MMFVDRKQAGKLLAKRVALRLTQIEGGLKHPRVAIALPRGGVPIAIELALELNCELDFLMAKKIRHPKEPELAVGAVCAQGVSVFEPDFANAKSGSQAPVLHLSQNLQVEAQRQEREWLGILGLCGHLSLAGKTAIICDDGIATGMTAIAALRSAKQLGAACLVLATPVMPYESYSLLSSECDGLVSIALPHNFRAVGNYYLNFSQVEESEALAELKRQISRFNRSAD